MSSVNKLVDEEEAAKFLNVSPRSMSKWRSTKEHGIPFVKIGRAVRYSIEDLESYIEKHTHNKAEG